MNYLVVAERMASTTVGLLLVIAVCYGFSRDEPNETWPEENTNIGHDIDPAVIGGSVVSKHELPWIVSLQYPDQYGELKHFCGGSIISKRLILTAAHCLYDSYSNDLIDQSQIRIKGGSNNPHNSTGLSIDYIIPHPNYSNLQGMRYLQSDIAILRLSSNIQFNNRVQPIELPPANEIVDPNSSVSVAGWGFTKRDTELHRGELKKISEWLQKVPLRVVSDTTCHSRLTAFTVTDQMICTDSTAVDICQGDSGGALYRKISEDGKIRYRIVGIVSGSSKGCGKNNGASVFTKVTSYLKNFILPAKRQCDKPGGCSK